MPCHKKEKHARASNIPRIGSDCGEGVHRDPKETWNSTSSTQGPSPGVTNPSTTKHQQWHNQHQSFHKKNKKMTPYLLIGEGVLLACWLQELDAICGSDGYGRINVVGSWGGRKMVHVNTTWENKDVFPWGPEELRDLKGKWALNRVPRVLHHCWSMVGCTGCGCAWNGNQCYCRHGHMSGIKWATCRLFVLVHLLVHIHRNTYYKCGVESSVHEQFIDLIYQKGMWLCSTIWHTQRIISHESYIENNLCTLKCIKHQRQLSLTNNLQTTSAKPTTSTQTT